MKVIGKEELVLTAATVLHDFFYPEEREDELVEAAPPVETEESHDTVAAQASAEEEDMETENSGLASSDGIGDTEAARAVDTDAQEAVGDNAGSAEEAEAVTDEVPLSQGAGDNGDTGAEESSVQEASTSTGGLFKCSVCMKSFKNKSYYRFHHQSHIFGNKFKCRHCDKSFSHKKTLNQHEKQQHDPDQEQIVCPVCGKHFKSHIYLKNHMVLHDKKDKKQSRELKQEALQLIKLHGKAETARRLNISYSSIKHWEAKEKNDYTCNHCGKKLVDSTRLREHERKMHGKN